MVYNRRLNHKIFKNFKIILKIFENNRHKKLHQITQIQKSILFNFKKLKLLHFKMRMTTHTFNRFNNYKKLKINQL
jgi:hypothetical protein